MYVYLETLSMFENNYIKVCYICFIFKELIYHTF